MTTGIIGVPLGSYLSQRFGQKDVRWDAYICAIGLLLSAPLVAAAMIVVTVSAPAAYILVFLGEIALNLNWAVVADITLVRFFRFFAIKLHEKTTKHVWFGLFSI